MNFFMTIYQLLKIWNLVSFRNLDVNKDNFNTLLIKNKSHGTEKIC